MQFCLAKIVSENYYKNNGSLGRLFYFKQMLSMLCKCLKPWFGSVIKKWQKYQTYVSGKQ